MSALSTKTKARVGVKTAKHAVQHPKLTRRAARGARPVIRGAVNTRTLQARDQAAAALDGGRSVGQTIFEAGQQVAQARVPRKRVAPRIGVGVALGVAVGAAAMYLLDPANGNQRRRTVLRLGTPKGRPGHQHDEPDADNEAGGPAHPAPGHMPPEQR